MTAVDASGRPDTQEMIVAHRVFRREAALLPRLVESVPDGGTKRAALIAGHYRDYQLGLHDHHSAEDEKTPKDKILLARRRPAPVRPPDGTDPQWYRLIACDLPTSLVSETVH